LPSSFTHDDEVRLAVGTTFGAAFGATVGGAAVGRLVGALEGPAVDCTTNGIVKYFTPGISDAIALNIVSNFSTTGDKAFRMPFAYSSLRKAFSSSDSPSMFISPPSSGCRKVTPSDFQHILSDEFNDDEEA
jgi:hypothetical protein